MEYRFDFDDQLPDLPIAFDLDAVAQLFQEKLTGPGTLVKVNKLQDAKYRPSTRCVATYEMVIDRQGQLPEQTIGVLEFTPDGVKPRHYLNDPRLPWLNMATDSEEMRKRICAALNQIGISDEDVKLQEIEPVRYKPGLHCVIRYTVDLPSGQQKYYGKLFSHNIDPLINDIANLHRASIESPEMPRIPQPLAYWPDMNMVLQPAVASGIEFTKFAYDPAYDGPVREEWMRKAGATLAALHQCTVPGELRTIQEDLEDLHEYTSMMEKVKPELAERFEGVIKQIIDKIGDHQEPKPVASHGAMRTDQFILQGDQLAIIDLDGYCWSNPARDLGNFLAYLCWKAIRQPEHGQYVERAGRTFLEGYLELQPDIDEYWLSIYQAASLLKIAGRRFRSLTFLEWPLVIHLMDSAVASLKEDMGSLELGSIEDKHGTLIAHLSTSTSKTKFPATFIDKEFPALWGALNAEIMNNELSDIISPLACPETPLAVRRAKLLAYKPGKRGVIRYDLSGVDCHPQGPVFGKIYPEPYLCERAYRVMQTLSEDVFQGLPNLGVPHPLGYIPQLSMLVFVPAEGEFLGELISRHRLDSPEVIRTMELAGAWLAQLHTHRFPLEKQFKVENEIDNIHQWAQLIIQKYPDEARAVHHLAAYLIDQASVLRFDEHIPIHKDFHYEHILVNGGLKVFDFDEMRLGDPNFDLAHFCANFYLLAYRNHKHTPQFSSLQNHFFNTYASQTNWELGDKFLFFYIYSCLKIAKQLCKLRGPRPWPEGEEQHAQVWLMLEQGLATLSHARSRRNGQTDFLPMVEFSQIRRSGWLKAARISKSDTSSDPIHVSHRPLS
jgi:aminoglycoside phosphotransferase (APT) family kinase protein